MQIPNHIVVNCTVKTNSAIVIKGVLLDVIPLIDAIPATIMGVVMDQQGVLSKQPIENITIDNPHHILACTPTNNKLV